MKSILLIEDDPDILDNITDLLEAEGFEVLCAPNGHDGIAIARREIPNLIISDVTMPEVDGYEVLETLKADPATATIPFIFLTALADHSEQRRGMNQGADDYLSKPFKAEELLEAVHARLDKREQQHKSYEERLRELGRNISRIIPHEFRTPLGVIIGYAQMISEDTDLFQIDEIRDMMRDVYSAGERLEELAEKYTFLAEVEVLRSDSEEFVTLSNTYIDDVTDIIRTQAERLAGRHERLQDLVQDLMTVSVRMNPDHLRTLVSELLENAFKFSKAGSPILVSCRDDFEGQFLLEIQDRGRGMRNVHIEQINAFVQFDRDSYEQQGLGVGLYTVKRIAELYGGSFVLASRLDEGTTARIALPIVTNETEPFDMVRMGGPADYRGS